MKDNVCSLRDSFHILFFLLLWSNSVLTFKIGADAAAIFTYLLQGVHNLAF